VCARARVRRKKRKRNRRKYHLHMREIKLQRKHKILREDLEGTLTKLSEH
jgi:hypothetical protein